MQRGGLPVNGDTRAAKVVELHRALQLTAAAKPGSGPTFTTVK